MVIPLLVGLSIQSVRIVMADAPFRLSNKASVKAEPRDVFEDRVEILAKKWEMVCGKGSRS